MNFLLNFRLKEHEYAYTNSIHHYLEKTFRFSLSTLFIYLTGQMYLMISNYGVGIGLATDMAYNAGLFLFCVLLKSAQGRINKLTKCTPWLRIFNDIVILLVVNGAMLGTVSLSDGDNYDPPLAFHNGFWWGVIICLLNLASSKWSSRILQVSIGFLIIILRNLNSPNLVRMIVGSINLVVLGICYYYTEELIAKKDFLDKYRAFEEASSLRTIVNDIYEGIIIYSTKQKKTLFSNKSVNQLAFWDLNLSMEENFKHLKITRVRQRVRIESPGLQEEVKKYPTLNEFMDSLINEEPLENSDNAPNYMIDVKYQSDEFADERKFEIQPFKARYNDEDVWTFIIRDTTERDMLITLQDNNKYKTRLLASVSHELRTPLNSSIIFTEKAIEHESTPEVVKNSYLKPTLNSCKILLHVINDILDFSQMQANKLRLVFEEKNILDTIRECIDLVSIQAERKGIYLKTSGFDEVADPRFKTDHNRVRQIMLNLLSNAMKFTYEGGITVHARVSLVNAVYNNEDNIITFPAYSGEDEKEEQTMKVIRIEVQDTGIGIKKEDQKKLFKAFEKIELGDKIALNSTGAGLGLVISNDLARSLGPPLREKPIEISSEEGKGSRFCFEIAYRESANLDLSPIASRNKRYGSHDYSRSFEAGSQAEEGSLRLNLETMTFMKTEAAAPLFKTTSLNNVHVPKDIYITSPERPLLMSNRELMMTFRQGSPKPECKCPKILIADDDIFNIAALESILHSMSVSTVSAFNGKIAMEKYIERENTRCGSHCNPFNLIFMDCNMPVMDGYEASTALKQMMDREEIRQCPIIACTAFAQDSEIERCKIAGIDDLVTKPLIASLIKIKLKKFGIMSEPSALDKKNREDATTCMVTDEIVKI